MPVGFFPAVAFIFGIIIGSFLNVLVYRLHTGKSLSGNSHCLSCGQHLSWYELVPLLSYLFLRGRCRHCGCYIPYRYLLVEFLTGLAFLLASKFTDDLFVFAIMCTLLSTLIVGAVYDLYHLIIPDEVSLFVLFLAAVFVAYEVAALPSPLLAVAFDAFLGGALVFGIFATLWLISGGTWMGFADAKLAFGLGMFTGLSGAFSLLVLSFWLGAIVSLALISFQYLHSHMPIFTHSKSVRHAPDTLPPVASVLPRVYYTSVVRPMWHLRYILSSSISKMTEGRVWGRVNMKSEVPFAPFLIAAFVLVFFFGVDVLSLSSYVAELVSF